MHPIKKDLTGEYFTKDTYFGARDGDGCDTLFHHGIPLKKGLEDLADHVFAPIKTTKDDIGIFAETVLNQSDKYEAKVLELVNAGKLGWSSGSSSHLVKREKDGRLKRWIISEGSLTHMPCDPMNRAVPIKSLEVESEEFNVKGIFEEQLAENTPWRLAAPICFRDGDAQTGDRGRRVVHYEYYGGRAGEGSGGRERVHAEAYSSGYKSNSGFH
jgi:hypothetical protein